MYLSPYVNQTRNMSIPLYMLTVWMSFTPLVFLYFPPPFSFFFSGKCSTSNPLNSCERNRTGGKTIDICFCGCNNSFKDARRD